MRLLFILGAIPRNTTREEWRKIWRWKRETEKRLAKAVEDQFTQMVLYGTTDPMPFDGLIRPPVIAYPSPPKPTVSFKPGSVNLAYPMPPHVAWSGLPKPLP